MSEVLNISLTAFLLKVAVSQTWPEDVYPGHCRPLYPIIYTNTLGLRIKSDCNYWLSDCPLQIISLCLYIQNELSESLIV